MPSDTLTGPELRQAVRLPRQPEHTWQLRLEDDRLITKNIVNLSAGGMAFKAPLSSDIHPGQPIKFSLSIESGAAFECEGRVLWGRVSSDKPGSMKQFGVQFSKLPPSLDAAIVKQVDLFAAKSKREKYLKNKRPLAEKIVMSAPKPLRAILIKILGAILIVSLTGAFVAALLMHRDGHSATQSLARKISSDFDSPASSSIDR